MTIQDRIDNVQKEYTQVQQAAQQHEQKLSELRTRLVELQGAYKILQEQLNEPGACKILQEQLNELVEATEDMTHVKVEELTSEPKETEETSAVSE